LLSGVFGIRVSYLYMVVDGQLNMDNKLVWWMIHGFEVFM